MNLVLKRIYTNNQYTIGHLYIDGVYLCDVIEDTDRGLDDSMTEEEIRNKKVYCETAIPYGTYRVILTWSMKFKRLMPRLLNVKGFDGILIHVGNYATQSCGCILVGYNTQKGMVTSSVYAFNKLMDKYLIPATERNEEIYITITSDYH